MGEQRVDATLRLGWIEDELRLPAFLGDCVVVIHGDGSVGVPVGRDAQAKDQKVDNEGKCRCSDKGQGQIQKPPLETGSEVRCRGRRHGANYKRFDPLGLSRPEITVPRTTLLDRIDNARI